MTDLLTSLTLPDLEAVMARRSFPFFLKFVRVQNTDLEGSADMPFEFWDHLRDVVDILEGHDRIIFLKSRQIGITWILAAYALWTALYHDGAVVLILSKGQDEAKTFLRRTKFIHDKLPSELQLELDLDSTTEYSFKNSSKITALPATEDAGRSETASVVIQDEADYHKSLKENYAAIRPTVDSGGQHIIASTKNYQTIQSFFTSQYRRANTLIDTGLEGAEHFKSAHDGVSKYVKVFMGWRVRPGRDEDWRSDIVADYEDEDQLSKEHPETEAEALSPPKSLAAFNVAAIQDMIEHAQAPLTLTGYPESARVWEKFRVGMKYASFTDTSHGVGKDNAVTVIGNCNTGLIVADIMSSLLDPDVLADQSVKLLGFYDNPIWGIEDNDWGIQTIKRAQALGYKRLYHRPLSAAQPNKRGMVGWHTDETKRKVLFGDLQQAVKDRALMMFALDGLGQFTETIKNPDKGGRIEAIEGGNDDYPLAVGGMLQMIPYARKAKGDSFAPPGWDFRERPKSTALKHRWDGPV